MRAGSNGEAADCRSGGFCKLSENTHGRPIANALNHPDLVSIGVFRSAIAEHSARPPVTTAPLRCQPASASAKTANWLKNSGRDQDTQGIKPEREGQIPPDVAHRRVPKVAGAHDSKQIAPHDRNTGAFDRAIGSRAHGRANAADGARRCTYRALCCAARQRPARPQPSIDPTMASVTRGTHRPPQPITIVSNRSVRGWVQCRDLHQRAQAAFRRLDRCPTLLPDFRVQRAVPDHGCVYASVFWPLTSSNSASTACSPGFPAEDPLAGFAAPA